MNMNNNKFICIEGNIGSGKSTLLKELEEKYKENKEIIFLKEPVDEWATIKDEKDVTMLEKFYGNQEKYSFPFQMMAFISRLSILKKVMKENKNTIIISERSLFTDRYVFAKMLYDQKKIEDVNYQIYLKWFDEFANEFPVNNVIYVNADPSICYQRINKRSRNGEENIALQYLELCHNYHEDFIKINMDNCQKLLLDGNIDIFEKNDTLDSWIQLIDDFINCYMV